MLGEKKKKCARSIALVAMMMRRREYVVFHAEVVYGEHSNVRFKVKKS